LFFFLFYKSRKREVVVEILEEVMLFQIALFLGLALVLLRIGDPAVDARIGDDSRASLPTSTF
jgi:hypothetical protein